MFSGSYCPTGHHPCWPCRITLMSSSSRASAWTERKRLKRFQSAFMQFHHFLLLFFAIDGEGSVCVMLILSDEGVPHGLIREEGKLLELDKWWELWKFYWVLLFACMWNTVQYSLCVNRTLWSFEQNQQACSCKLWSINNNLEQKLNQSSIIYDGMKQFVGISQWLKLSRAKWRDFLVKSCRFKEEAFDVQSIMIVCFVRHQCLNM